MASWTKRELKRANKEKKRCKRLYADWVDNEFNCGPNKFIFGVISDANSILETKNYEVSFNTLNDLQVYYNRDAKKYLLDIEVGYNKSCETEIQYLDRLLKEFKNFIQSHYSLKLSYLLETSLFTFLDDISNYWSADDLITLYCKFYIFVQGYKQNLRNKKYLDIIEDEEIQEL